MAISAGVHGRLFRAKNAKRLFSSVPGDATVTMLTYSDDTGVLAVACDNGMVYAVGYSGEVTERRESELPV